jgi:hypothetical protein
MKGTLDLVLTRRPKPVPEVDLPFEVYVEPRRLRPVARRPRGGARRSIRNVEVGHGASLDEHRVEVVLLRDVERERPHAIAGLLHERWRMSRSLGGERVHVVSHDLGVPVVGRHDNVAIVQGVTVAKAREERRQRRVHDQRDMAPRASELERILKPTAAASNCRSTLTSTRARPG